MTPNYSLQLSTEIKELMKTDLLQPMKDFFPNEVIDNYKPLQEKRDRVFNMGNTLLTMTLTAVQEDRSLQNSVNLFSKIHKNNIEKMQLLSVQKAAQEHIDDQKSKKKKKAGRPKSYKPKLSKSKQKKISTNTSAYTQARQRLEQKLVDLVFEESTNFKNIKINCKWKGKDVFITDGTYIQMQDTEELREVYEVKCRSGKKVSAYPQGLLQVLIRQGSGAINQFGIGSRHVSELKLFSSMIPKLKKHSVILADDLYSTYAIFSSVLTNELDIIVPGKRKRNYMVIKKIAEGDKIVELKNTARPKWLSKDVVLLEKIYLRRITYEDPNKPGKECVLYTTILDESISKTDIIIKYLTRWDVEITIREIKTLMGINIARSKTPEMVLKEITISLIAYNLIRKMIATTTENSGFSPKADFFQKCFEVGKTIHIDKKGRVYKRWSPGRYGGVNVAN